MVYDEEIYSGDPVQNILVDGILSEIEIISKIKIPDLEGGKSPYDS